MDPQKIADAAAKAIETVPELYKDGLKKTTQHTGDLAAMLPRALKAALYKQEAWIIDRENAIKAYQVTKDLMLEHLKDADPYKIVPPEAYIATPALEAIAESIDNEKIREMYAKLLAKAVVLDTKDDVHPAFVQIIRQMSPRDASNLSVFPDTIGITLPVGKYVERWSDEIGYNETAVNIFLSNPKYSDIDGQAASISLLNTLGLISVDYNAYCPYPNVYDPFIVTSLYKSLEKRRNERNNQIEKIKGLPEAIRETIDIKPIPENRHAILDFLKGTTQLTPFGLKFKQVCID